VLDTFLLDHKTIPHHELLKDFERWLVAFICGAFRKNVWLKKIVQTLEKRI
jgi:hypothetical protein